MPLPSSILPSLWYTVLVLLASLHIGEGWFLSASRGRVLKSTSAPRPTKLRAGFFSASRGRVLRPTKLRAGFFGSFDDDDDDDDEDFVASLTDLKNDLKRDELAEIAAMAGAVDTGEAQRLAEAAEVVRKEQLLMELAAIKKAAELAALKADLDYELDPEKSITRIDVDPGDVWSP